MTTKREIQDGSELFRTWLAKYPDSRFAEQARFDLEHDIMTGHFSNAVYNNDLDTAFARADIGNLKILEELTGITKEQYGRDHWGW